MKGDKEAMLVIAGLLILLVGALIGTGLAFDTAADNTCEQMGYSHGRWIMPRNKSSVTGISECQWTRYSPVPRRCYLTMTENYLTCKEVSYV